MNAIGPHNPSSRYATADDWARFLAPLATAVKGAVTRQDVIARAAACAEALAIFPEWLTPQRRRDAMAAFQFWPSVAEIGGLFTADQRHAMEMRALTARPALPAPERGPRSMAEILAVQQTAQAFKAEMAARTSRAAPGSVDRPTPRPLPHAQLLAQYDALAARGNAAAKARAAALRKALAS